MDLKNNNIEVDQLIAIMESVAAGNYSNDALLEFTKAGHDESIRRLAEAFGMMMVNIEVRECHLEKLNEELRQLNNRMQKNVLQTVITIAHSLGARDIYTEGHGHRVARYATKLARQLNFSDDEVVNIRIAGYLHDIGKIGFSDKVFNNETAKPSEEIMDEIQHHTVRGVEILKDLEFLKPVLDFILYHHEREDGSGYPEGLKGDAIPLGAKIISIADTFDALTTDRAYQQGKSQEEAFAILHKLAESGKINPQLLQTFISAILEQPNHEA